MNNKNINEEIEILDGLDDFFATNNNKEDKAKEVEIFEPIKEDVKKEKIDVKEDEPIFSFDDELFKPSEEEVLNVLDEPVVDMEKIKDEEKKEVPFTNFVPDNINMDVKTNETLMKEDVKEEKKEPERYEIPSMDEIFYMDFDKFEQKEEKNESKPEINNVGSVEIKTPTIEPFDQEISIDNQVNEVPSFDQEEDLDKTNFYLDEILEPVSLEEPKEEITVQPKEEVKIEQSVEPDIDPFAIDNSIFDSVNLEPVESVNNDELEKTNFDINYTLSDQNDNKELENTIDNAFAFDGEDTFNQNLGTNNNDLGETVIIEPVDLKPVEKVEEVVPKEEVKENTNVESNAGLQVVEEKKVVENNATEIQTEVKKEDKVKTKKDGRFFVLILLIVMLLLSFVILLPTIIEKFAI